MSIAQKMASQGSDAATQVLSPSHIESILNSRSRSALQQQDAGQDRDEEEEGQTQFTLHEGDEGHIDIVSSLMSPLGVAKEMDSDPVDFSPSQSQSQRALSQFPESQRFKTPATAGKKRRHNGDTVDSPALPRNPLRRGDVDDDAPVMGLSQAFAATQANTSPFVGDPHVDLRSDRPSPNIQLQPRPMTAASSSPMRPITSAFQRASTEPAARYISAKESQEERQRQALLKQQERMAGEEDSDDAFDDEPSSMTKDWRLRQIEQRRRATFQRLSSPPKGSGRGGSLSKSSPLRSPTCDSPRGARNAHRAGVRRHPSPTRGGPVSPGNDSEEETEQEDNVDIAVTRSSQGQAVFEDEDKENYSERGSQIPETTARLIRVSNELPSQIQDSPSLRRGRAVNGADEMAPPYSSGPFAVADSQPIQPQRQIQADIPLTKRIDDKEGVDYVSQSPTRSLQPTQVTSKNRATGASELDRIEEEGTDTATGHAAPESPSRQQPRSTIPETSSNEQGQNEKSAGKSSEKLQSSESCGQYKTAQTKLPPSSASSDQGNRGDLSSPPIATTPPGRRRKRLAEIAAAPSPLKSQMSFSVSDALKLDQNFQSPLRKTPTIDRRTLEEPTTASSQDEPASIQDADVPHNSEPDVAQHDVDHSVAHPSTPDSEHIAPSPGAQTRTPLSTRSRQEREPSAKVVVTAVSRSETSHATSRRATWDLDASPPQKSVPVIKASGLKRKAKDIDGTQNKPIHGLTKRLKTGRSDPLSKAAAQVVDGRSGQEDSHGSPDPLALNVGQSSDVLGQGFDVAKQVVPVGSETLVAPNMVFACFNGKTRAYYPALCLGPSNAEHTRFTIQWEGYDPDEIDKHGIRSLDLQIGDQVKANMEGVPKVSYVIRGFKDKIEKASADVLTDVRGHKTLLVAPKQRKSLPSKISTDAVREVPVSAIYLDSNMWGQMRDRVYKYKAVDQISSSGVSTPLGRPSTPSTPPSRTRRSIAIVLPTATAAPPASLPIARVPRPPRDGKFSNMAFAISYEDRSRKTALVDLIEGHGGVVLQESFLDLLDLESTTEIQLKHQFAELGFTALLTERHSRKEKYMQALALGVPCLNGKWVEACVRSDRDRVVDWTIYLLPAGESAELDGATRSRLLPAAAAAAAGNEGRGHMQSQVKVKDMISSRPSIFGSARAIVVMGKGKAEARRKPYLFLIRALGAGKIDTEPDLASAKARIEMAKSGLEEEGDGSGTVQWVFVDDRDIRAARALFSASTSTSMVGSTSVAGSGSPASFTANNHKDKSRRKSRSKRHHDGVEHSPVQDDSHDQNANAERNPDSDNGIDEGNQPTSTVTVKVMCNEDIVQSLILGKLWMGQSG